MIDHPFQLFFGTFGIFHVRLLPNCHVNFVFHTIHCVQCLFVVATSNTTVLFCEKAYCINHVFLHFPYVQHIKHNV